MGGYGVYVWSAYGITFFGLLLHYLMARKQFQKSWQVVSETSSQKTDKEMRTVTFRKLT